jgi:hypothetical protein
VFGKGLGEGDRVVFAGGLVGVEGDGQVGARLSSELGARQIDVGQGPA